MSLIKRMRKQRAMYFASTGQDRFGKMKYADPVEIRCRWEERSQEYVTDAGQEKLSNAVVYVDRRMKEGELLWQGTAEEFAALKWDKLKTPAENIDDVFPIQQFQRLPNLKAKEFLLTAIL